MRWGCGTRLCRVHRNMAAPARKANLNVAFFQDCPVRTDRMTRSEKPYRLAVKRLTDKMR